MARRGRSEQSGAVELTIADAAATQAHWPIGWPYEGRPDAIAPKLLDRLDVEIEPLPLDEVMSALQPRLELPLVWDQNGMARERIDPQFDEVSHAAAERVLYMQVVRRVLYQARLKYELRVDDGGKPLLWITPIPRN